MSANFLRLSSLLHVFSIPTSAKSLHHFLKLNLTIYCPRMSTINNARFSPHFRAKCRSSSALLQNSLKPSRRPFDFNASNFSYHFSSMFFDSSCHFSTYKIFRALPGALDGYFHLLMPSVKASVSEKTADSSSKIDTLQFLHIAFYSHEATVRTGSIIFI